MNKLVSINSGIKALSCLFKMLLYVFLFLFILPASVSAFDIVAVQSLNIKPYNDAVKGFESACGCKLERFVVSEMKDIDITKEVREARPDVIIAIGSDALEKVSSVRNIPVVYMMVLNPKSFISNRTNATGISMQINPENQLSVLKKTLPGAKRVGLLFDPLKTGDFVNKALVAAKASGIELVAKEVRSSQDVPERLKDLKGEISVFWMLPDLTVITPETAEFLFLSTLESKIPVMTFSEKYLHMGALISLDLDAYGIGKQAWSITNKILAGAEMKFDEAEAEDAVITVNQKIAKKLGITIEKDILKNIRIINENKR